MRKEGTRVPKWLILLIFAAIAVFNIYALVRSGGIVWLQGEDPGTQSGEVSVNLPETITVSREEMLMQLNTGLAVGGQSVNSRTAEDFEIGVCWVDVYCCDAYRFSPISGTAVSWTSSDEGIATVDANGVVRTFKAGTALITATDASGNTDTCTINVIKVAYITIDDTPTEYTPKLLDILDKYGVKATFFMNADPDEAEQYREIYRRGHTFALHGYAHKTKYADGEAFLANMEKCRQFLMETTGCEYVDNIIRFPTGSKGMKNYSQILDYMHSQDYTAFDWTTEFHDYYYHSASGCLEYFKQFLDKNYANRSDDYAVILFHPREWSVEALPEALEYIIDQGYTFATITRDTAEYNFYKRYCDE